ncbi:MAG: hypothetical protein KAW56_15985, partial [Candidatus Marinimicrobia bacterium]|nr:hypothetical protein [Candidatus Neomarinimicrobiota bacterium]
MRIQSRRQFIKSGFCLAVSGLSSIFISLFTGCKQKARSRANIVNKKGIERFMNDNVAKIDPNFEPGYLKLHRTGELKKRGEELWEIMGSCKLCPRQCGVNRLEGDEGFCQASSQLEISSYHPHFGEERPLVGSGGSGTIFFTNCGLRCVFCINWEISQGGEGKPRSIENMAQMMLDLQKIGCHNINIVTPTHYSP